MAIVMIGMNHKTAPVAVREQLAIPDYSLAEALDCFRHPTLDELVILSTCNRVEFYLETRDTNAATAAWTHFAERYYGIDPSTVMPHFVYQYDMDAVRHLFRVVSSLDSLVVGEPQILGQVKAAYKAARTSSRTGVIFNQLFDRALGVGKAVRHETGINKNAVSVSYAAVELAKKIFDRVQQRTVLVLGAGETSELAARHFVRQGVTNVFVANRTLERAEQLAHALMAKAIPWESIAEYLVQTDIVVSSTSASHPIIDKAMVQETMRTRKSQPMFFIDIAVPRDIDPEVNTIDNVFLYDMDALEHVVKTNRHERQREAIAAEELVSREVQNFQQWLEVRDAVPTIVALRQYADRIRRAELEKAVHRLGNLDEHQRRAIEAFSTGMVNKLLHMPTVNLKRSTNQGRLRDYVQLIGDLFDLPHQHHVFTEIEND